MPAQSEAQRRLMAMRVHNPSKIYARNRGVLGMSREKAHEFTSGSDLPQKVAKAKKHRGR